ncbi:MAG TPA: hypothetical protein ENN23_04840 [Deltaproteobacteria bacterium]|nr:hypothetical protein [Deltaproteobacteria bacterium]
MKVLCKTQAHITAGTKFRRFGYPLLGAFFLFTAALLFFVPHASAGEFSWLRSFGYEFFHEQAAATSFADKKIIPVPRQYRLGPQDEVNVFIGGAPGRRHHLSVDAEGRLHIPGFGSVFVAGMTFEEMSRQVIGKIEKTAKAPVDISMTARKIITVFIRGEAVSPMPCSVGAFATVTEALRLAGGPKETGSLRDIQVIRKGITVASFDLYELLLKGVMFRDITLMEGDEIFVPPKGTEVAVTGSVMRPAVYEMKGNEGLEDLLAHAGGILPETGNARVRIKRGYKGEKKVIYDAAAEEINLKKSVPPVLSAGDMVLIYSSGEIIEAETAAPDTEKAAALPAEETVPGREIDTREVIVPRARKFVTLTGEFKNPGRYSIHQGEKLSSVIERAGGYTGGAYLRAAVFTRESVREIQQRKLDEAARKIKIELDSSARAGGSKTQKTGNEQMHRENFVARVESLEASGRLSVHLAHLRLLKGSVYDIEMESGDHLHIPRTTNMVNIDGAVAAQGPRVYDSSWDYKNYIEAAGGYARGADTSNVFVLKVDGSVRKLSRSVIRWSERNERWEISAFGRKVLQIEAGDVIVVPEKPGQVSWLGQIKDIPALMMNMAALTGTVLEFW